MNRLILVIFFAAIFGAFVQAHDLLDGRPIAEIRQKRAALIEEDGDDDEDDDYGDLIRKRREATSPSMVHEGHHQMMDDSSDDEDMMDMMDDMMMLSSVDHKLAKCLQKLPAGKTIDLLLDMSPNSLKNLSDDMITMYGGSPKKPEDLPMTVAKHVSDITELLAADVPLDKVQIIIQNGTTRSYIYVDEAATTTTSTTTAAATTTVEGQLHVMLKPEFFPKHEVNALAEKVKRVLADYFNGRELKLSTTRKASTSPLFTVVVTDGSQRTPVKDFGEPSLILDICGGFAHDSNGYTTHNVIIAHPPEMIFSLMTTARYQVCQHLGGVADDGSSSANEHHASGHHMAAATTTPFYPTTHRV